MSTLQSIVFLVATFVLCQPSDAYKNYNKTHYVFLDEWGTIGAKSKDGRVMYSNCTGKATYEKNCSVVVEKTAYSNDSYVCDVSLKSDHAKGTIGKKMKLLGAIGNDKVLFYWQENNKRRGRYFTYAILNLEDCKFATAKIDKRSVHSKTTAVLYDNSFDVFFKNKTICGDDICRITFDTEGKVLNEAHRYVEGNLIDKGWILEPISKESPDSGHFYVRVQQQADLASGNNTTTYYLVKNGTQKLLARLEGRPDVSVSTAHKVITACAVYKKSNGFVNCTRFDAEGNVLSAMTLSSKDNKKKRILSIRNTIEGNLLVLYKTLSESNGFADTCCRVTLTKFDSNGEILRSKVVENYCGESLDISEDKDGNYCIMNGYTNEPDNMWGVKELSFNYQCFNDIDLF